MEDDCRTGKIAWSLVCICLAICLAGCPGKSKQSTQKTSPPKTTPEPTKPLGTTGDQQDQLVENLIAVEDLTLDLTFRLKELAAWIVSGSEPTAPAFCRVARSTTAAKLSKREFVSLTTDASPNVGADTKSFLWPLSPDEHSSQENDTPFAPLSTIEPFFGRPSAIKFGILWADFAERGRSEFVMQAKLSGKYRSAGRPAGVLAIVETTWKLGVDGEWSLTAWEAKKIEVTSAGTPIFVDVTKTAIADPKTFQEVQRSRHEELISETVNTGQMPKLGKYSPYIDAASPHVLPSISVVDFDNDQLDDLFVTGRWCPTTMLKNQGNGSFTDVTETVGLRFPAVVNCSAFVDFDNDGDQDVLIGRALEPLAYLRNDNGHYVDVTRELSNLGDQFMVSAISVSDINRDGWPDLYLSTYGPFGQNAPKNLSLTNDWRIKFLGTKNAIKLTEKHLLGHGFVDNAGPPNQIVMNRGEGRLERIDSSELVQQWHHSYQSAWADVDNDGDDDLYIANDFAGDGLLINETPTGSKMPVFSNGMQKHFGKQTSGFGMGASWGDYDSDGDIDLYVSNMYSKAGSRILKFLGPGDPRMEIATQGNFLFQNNDGRLTNVAGEKEGQQNVGHVGWSYGGQFMDIDNNGFLDLYVPSGYYTAVSAGDTNVDI